MSRGRELRLAEAVSTGISYTRPWGYLLAAGPLSREVRLVVVPPGTTAGRHRLWLLGATWQRYVWILAGTALIATLLFTRAEWIFAITAGVGVWILGSILVRLVQNRQTQRPRELRATVISTRGGFTPVGAAGTFVALAKHLDFLDALEREGRVTPAQYAQEWGAIYRALPSSERKATRS